MSLTHANAMLAEHKHRNGAHNITTGVITLMRWAHPTMNKAVFHF
ncbi:MAG: hypothetical protein ACLSAH_09255 [Bilophila wadsworthia]